MSDRSLTESPPTPGQTPQHTALDAKQDQLLTAAEVAKLLRVSVQWVYSHGNGNRRPQIPSKKLGGARRFSLREVMAFVDKCAESETA
jgi:predicted DNA-binding transcriptional regulator AlpA